MKLRRSKKGFTVVELVIVIAVIAVLAAILIPTFISLNNKANKAADDALVKNLNTALSAHADEGKNATMYDALQDALDAGYKVENLKSKSGQNLVWDQDKDEFSLVKDNAANYKLWKVYSQVPALDKQGFSIYLNNKEATTAEVKVGFDAGENTALQTVSYAQSAAAQEVIIRTSGDQAILTIDAPNDDVKFYGFAKEINVTAVKASSLHLHGSCNKLALTSGHVVVENTGVIFEVTSIGTGASVQNNGYVGGVAEGVNQEQVSGKTVNSEYEIYSLSQLETFRDTVNAGNSFAGHTVKLMSDITLNNGWRPIGEGYRKVVAGAGTDYTGRAFKGTFNGNGKTISNLTNKGFVPTASRIVLDDGENTYAYGLFAIISNGAVIRDLTLKDVNISRANYDGAAIDSAAGLVGFAAGSFEIDGITVSGSISGKDGIGGIVGRAYATEIENNNVAFTMNIKNCVNNAAITATANGGKAAGIAAMVGDISNATDGRTIALEIKDCQNKGAIASTDTTKSYAAGILGYVTNTRGQNWKVTNCTNSGTVDAVTKGELVGYNPNNKVDVTNA